MADSSPVTIVNDDLNLYTSSTSEEEDEISERGRSIDLLIPGRNGEEGSGEETETENNAHSYSLTSSKSTTIDEPSDEMHHLYGEDFCYETDWPYRPFSLWMLFGYYAKNVEQAPNGVVWALTLGSWVAILAAVVSILLEILMAASAIPSVQFRGGSLMLTLLSALLAVHTLADLIDNELDTTVQAMRISLFVGVGAIFADLEFVLNPGEDSEWLRVVYKVPFMALNGLNVLLVLFAVFRLWIVREVFSVPYLFSCIPACRRVRKKRQREERERKFEEKIIREERRSREMIRKSLDEERSGSLDYLRSSVSQPSQIKGMKG